MLGVFCYYLSNLKLGNNLGLSFSLATFQEVRYIHSVILCNFLKLMFSDTTFHVDHEFHIGFYSIHLVWSLDVLENRVF